ncbi:MAG: ABC transporter permease [Oscillospiraceae bacterium]|jgi:NitT/TauT family transport system permease protein|nr:ABC transporter permease [Oscillospiraceae bacterium]
MEDKKIGKTIGKKLWQLFSYTISTILFLGLWELTARMHWLVNPKFLPPFTEVVATLWSIIVSGELGMHILVSLRRALMGFTLGCLFAVPLGLSIGWFKRFGNFISPLFQVFRNIPTLALLPVFVMFFGISETSKIVVIFWGVIWGVLLNSIAGVRSVDPQLIRASRSMGTSPIRLFATVILPASLPHIFAGMRLGATISILILVAAEMIGASRGLGYALSFYQAHMQYSYMYAYIIVMAVLGLLLNYTLGLVEKRSFRWRDESGATIDSR